MFKSLSYIVFYVFKDVDRLQEWEGITVSDIVYEVQAGMNPAWYVRDTRMTQGG
jgi:hypothetical protein